MADAQEPTFDWCAQNLVFSRDAIRQVDQQASDKFSMPGIMLMENAAIGLCRCVQQMLTEGHAPVTILCGPGNNGGDGFALARLLHKEGIETRIGALAPLLSYTGDTETNLEAAQRMGLVVRPLHHLEDDELKHVLCELADGAAIVVDAMLGTGSTSAPREPIAGAVHWLNDQRMQTAPWRVLAVDIPTGLDCDTGKPLGETVCADVTATMAGMKSGFLEHGAQEYTGDVEVVDIGVPVEVLVALGQPRHN